MARMTYAIVKADDCWRVISGRSRIGRFATCEQAALAATALAEEARRSDHDAEVLIQDLVGELWPVAQFDVVAACHACADAR